MSYVQILKSKKIEEDQRYTELLKEKNAALRELSEIKLSHGLEKVNSLIRRLR